MPITTPSMCVILLRVLNNQQKTSSWNLAALGFLLEQVAEARTQTVLIWIWCHSLSRGQRHSTQKASM